MHFDEYRPQELIVQQRIDELTSHPENAYVQLEKLIVQDRERESSELLRERDDLKRRLEQSHEELVESHGMTARVERERDVLRRKLIDLRASKTMQLGRAITAPVRAARLAVTEPEKFQERTRQRLKHSLRGVRRRIDIPAARFDWLNKHEDISSKEVPVFSDVGEQLTPSAESNADPIVEFENTLRQRWYVEGSLAATHEWIQSHQESFGREIELSAAARLLVDRATGAYRLQRDGVSIPPRSEHPAYVVEPERVMYAVHSTPIFNSNGYSTRTRGVAAGLKDAGEDVVVVARAGYPWDSATDVDKPDQLRTVRVMDGVSYVHTPGGHLNSDPFDSYIHQAADAFVREALMLRPRVIQSASNFRTALPALIAARRVGVPFVYEVRGLWELTEATAKPGFEETERFSSMVELETLVACEADAVLAITQQVADELVRRGVPAEKITLAPNAVDVDQFLPLPTDAAYREKRKLGDLPTIGFAGSIVDYEGLDVLLDASKLLEERGVDHQVVIAGSGKAEAGLKKHAVGMGLQNIHFLGRLPQDEIPRVLSVFDIVALPRKSTLITELVSPLKPLESFASGRATVLSDVAPHRDLAGAAGERAALFGAGDAESLADVLEELIRSEDLRAEYARHARLWAVRERTWTRIGQGMSVAHAQATDAYADQACDVKGMAEVKVGVIGDEFTRTTLAGAFDTTLLSRQDWAQQLEASDFDLVFVESAWEGNSGDWSRGVGHYSDEESDDLRALLASAQDRGIPTVFWNKEDPVHFARFAPNAALFDHVFTTDANMIAKYAATPGQRNKTIAALPFYAEPSIHNPLPSDRPFRDTVAYAGTYYGQRYADRSQGLDVLLASAEDCGLDIYDRQASNPESPYTFPQRYEASVRGSLSYQDVIKSYNTHVAQLNVNSVTDSPTMFSRRVVEIPACGGVLLSSASRGIAESLGTNIPALDDAADQRAMLHDWATNPSSRLSEVWRQMRTIYRSHTTDTALSMVCRIAGIPVGGVVPPSTVVLVNELNDDAARTIVTQSLRPTAVQATLMSDSAATTLRSAGIEVTSKPVQDYELEVRFDPAAQRTWLEDLTLPYRFGDWAFVAALPAEQYDGRTAIVAPAKNPPMNPTVRGTRTAAEGVTVYLPPSPSLVPRSPDATAQPAEGKEAQCILIAGHDLKFAQGIIAALQATGHEVLIDKWDSHTKHDEAVSASLLADADVVFCEWGLGNAVWYSRNLRSDQRLVIRVHSQELFRPFLGQIDHEAVDNYIFVGELIRSAAVRSHGVPRDKTIVIPNPVDVEALELPKTEEARWGIGMVGIVPQTKRPDLALDVLERLLEEDARFHLRIKGKTADDYPWMKSRPEEMAYYDSVKERIADINSRYPNAVRLDGFGVDMSEWYRNVGTVISVSTFESFHLTLADGAASGALPVSLAWPGADRIYPDSWLFGSVEEMADAIEQHAHAAAGEESFRFFVGQHFAEQGVIQRIESVISGS